MLPNTKYISQTRKIIDCVRHEFPDADPMDVSSGVVAMVVYLANHPKEK